MIKKIFLFILSLIVCLSFTACTPTIGDSGDGGGGENTSIVDETRLPEIRFTFPQGAPTKKEQGYVSGYVTTANCIDSEVLTDIPAEVKIRGNSTAKADKKPYRIKFNKKQSMLGLNGGNKYKNWVLLADAYDYSMMRNYFIYSFGNMLSNIHSTDCKHVSVYINNVFQGVYLLAEQNEVNEGRVDIDETKVETSANTGYLLEADSRALEPGECELFTPDMPVNDIDTSKDYCFKVVYKSKSTLTAPNTEQLFAVKSDLSTNKTIAHAQLTKIQNYMQKVYTAMFNYQGEDVLRSLIDVESAVDMFIVNNIASLRGGKRSEYYYIDFTDETPLLHFGPPWDYDLDCGNYDMVDSAMSFNGLMNRDYVNYTFNQNAWFKNLVKERWYELQLASKLRELVKTVNPNNPDAICNKYKTDFDNNFNKWKVWGKKNYEYLTDSVLEFSNHKDAVEYFYTWMSDHIEYADSQWRF